jgi:hypothetical protein
MDQFTACFIEIIREISREISRKPRFSTIIQKHKLILNHQFGFRCKYAIIEQNCQKLINNDMEANRYCTVLFFDISEAFDKLRHERLLYKIKNNFLTDFYAVIKSYLLHRIFRVKYGEVVTQLKKLNSEVP